MSDTAIAYNKPMVLLVPTSVWKLGVPLEGRALSSTQIVAYCLPPEKDSGMSTDDLDQLFRSSSNLEVQIHHQFEHLDVPVIPVNVLDIKSSTTGIELSFQISEITQAYDDLYNELTAP